MNFNDTLVNICAARELKDIVFVQQVSMRTYDTNEYQLLYDGNINLTLNRIYKLDRSYTVFITIPTKHNKSHLIQLKKFIADNIKCAVYFIPIEYGINADENRTVVPKNIESTLCVLGEHRVFVSDFELIDADIYTFATSKVDGMLRPYVDKWIDVQQKLTAPIFVLNHNQTILLPNAIIQDKVMSEALLNAKRDFYINAHNVSRDIDVVLNAARNEQEIIFFPFRISDRAYKFAEILALAKIYNWKIIATDNNHSGKEDPHVYYVKTEYKQTFYMQLLSSDIPFTILCFEDQFVASHQGIMELVYYASDKFKFIGVSEHAENYNNEVRKYLY